MNTKILLSVIMLSFLKANCQTPCNKAGLPLNLQNGLIGYYPFCNNALDQSGNQNNGNVHGASLSNDRFGNPNCAYSFNGSSDYIAADSIKQYVSNFTMTLSVWVKHTGYNTNTDCNWGCSQDIFTIGNDRDSGSFGLQYYQGNPSIWSSRIDEFWAGGNIYGTNNYPIPQSDWHHLVMSYDSTTIELYVDGLLDTAFNYTTTHNFKSDSIRIGKQEISINYPYYMSGLIDDIMIYNRVLTASEVNQVYTLSNLTPSVNISTSDTTFCEKQCIDFTDLSTNNPTSWQWSFPGADSTSSTLQNPTGICYNNYGSFDVTLIACNGAGCDTLILPNFINEYQSPVATIYQWNDTLFSSYGINYQWCDSSGPIAGANNYYYDITQPGIYYVIVTDTSGCNGVSNVLSITGINEMNLLSSVQIFPSPVTSTLSIQLPRTYEKLSVVIFNTIGEEVSILRFDNQNQIYIQTQNLKPGIYFISIWSEMEKIGTVKKFVKL